LSPATLSNLTFAAFYYPWYDANNFHGDAILRRQLNPPQYPSLGLYDQLDNATIVAQHVAWSRYANIGVWFSSWWGPNSDPDNVLKKVVFNKTVTQLGNLKIAILYETLGRYTSNLANFQTDMSYIAKTYFNQSNYYSINGRPVVFVYLTRWLQDISKLTQAMNNMRNGAKQQGYNSIYIIGDHVFGGYNPSAFTTTTCPTLMDAVGTYSVFGSMAAHGYAGNQSVQNFASNQKQWRDAAHNAGCAFIPGITPGFNNWGAGLSGQPIPLARQLTVNSSSDTVFRALLNVSLTLVERNMSSIGNLITVTSFNEWHEDTQIEPVVGFNGSKNTNLPLNLTNGIRYDAYGTMYLDIMRNTILS
jgi:glycoprotein endo-alpha-1,2-mannosidase